MKKIIAVMLALIMMVSFTACSGSSGGGGKKNNVNPQIGVTFIEGTAGVNEKEEGKFAFDFDLSTKWCMNFTGDSYAIWQLDEAVQPTGYTLITAPDAERYKCRNPWTWQIYAMRSDSAPAREDEGWVVIDAKEEDYRFPNKNTEKVTVPIENCNEKYNFFKIEVQKVHFGDIMQFSELYIEYPGSQYTYTGGILSSEKTFIGSSYITDDFSFDVRVADSLTLYHPGVPTTTLYAYYWDVVEEESDGEVILASSGMTCEVIGLKEGKVAVEGTLNYNSSVGYYSGETHIDTIKVYINVISKDAPKPNIGSVHNGSCPRCRGTKVTTCMACYGDGKLDGGKKCTGCSNGSIPCYFCGGSGAWDSPV